MRVFESLSEAEIEIRRDIYKGIPVRSSRVQQRKDQDLRGRERLAYVYSIIGDFPATPLELVNFGKDRGFPLYQKYPSEMVTWLYAELAARLRPETAIGQQPTECLNPALQTTIEGNYPSYTYAERLFGAMESMKAAILESPDSRRAYWPLFRPEDSLRSGSPTRVPCSVGYQALVRRVNDADELMLFYTERSCDFDHFWLSDVWLAHMFQHHLATQLGYSTGQLVHMVTSFHSFLVEDEEVY